MSIAFDKMQAGSLLPLVTIMSPVNYPFAEEFITDSQGRIRKVILDIADYQKLLEALEDEGLYRAMQDVADETPLSLEEALTELEQP